ncbi:MAG: acyl carrier protein [Acetobacteraceae bacterium]|jgi:acyl carrier protein|nr:acyl carrier protein [Acetobacteraceae bacterium]
MTEQERLATLTRILCDLLGDETIELTMLTTREDVPGWDSFCYVNFIVAVEAAFGIKFGIAEIESFANVGAIVTAIGARQER